MPYSVPAPTVAPFPLPLPVHSQGRVGHRRSYSYMDPPTSAQHAFAATTTTGAFASLGVLPRRRTPSSSPCSTTASAGARTPMGSTPKKPTFHFRQDEDDDEEDSPDDVRIGDDDDAEVLRTKLKPGVSLASPSTRPQIRVTTTMTPPPSSNGGAVPFPRTSPTSPPVLEKAHLPFSHSDDKLAKTNNSTLQPGRAYVSRTSSSPILLSNGKPLKSSLKSSSSSPNIPFPSQSLVPSIMFPQLHPHHPYNHQHRHHHHQHQRAASAPTTPRLSSSGASSPSPSTPGSPEPSSPSIQKNVHFPSQEEGGLATVRLFNRSAKPASLSRVGEDTETETEGEGYGSGGSGSGAMWTGGFNRAWSSVGYSSARVSSSQPFPRFGSGKDKEKSKEVEVGPFEVDQANSSPVPQRGAEHAVDNVFLETLGFDSSTATQLTLSGSLLVRNITYQKTVAVRFTMDEWHTTHEVHARHSKSLPDLPERFRHLSQGSVAVGKESQVPTVCQPISWSLSGAESECTVDPLAPTWDRFVFSMNMEDYKATLEKRTMWVVGRYVGGDGFGGGAGEWWDNNRGGNYRVRFRRQAKERKAEVVPTPTPAPAPAPVTQREEKDKFRRNVVVSAPPSFTPPKTTLSAPQLSSSMTFPGSSPHSLSYHQSIGRQQQTQDQRQRQEALTQSTVARLKKLSLRNYAAPAPVPSRLSYSSTPSGSPPHLEDARSERTLSMCSTDTTSTSTSASTSADSTPLQTPTQDEDEGLGYYPHVGKHAAAAGADHHHCHDVDVDVLNHAEDATAGIIGGLRPRWRMQVEGGHVATLLEVKPGVVSELRVEPLLRRALEEEEEESTPTGSGMGTPVTVPSPPPSAPAPACVQPTQDAPNPNPIPSLPMSIVSPRRTRSPVEEMMALGTSPPFSALAAMGLDSLVGVSLGMVKGQPANANATRAGGGIGNVRWGWGSSPSAGLEMGSMESVGVNGPVEVEKEEEEKKAPLEPKQEEEEEVTMDMDADTQVMLNDIKERSTLPPPPAAAAAAPGQALRRHHQLSREHSTYSTNGGLARLPQRRRAAPAKTGVPTPTPTTAGGGSGSDSSSSSSGPASSSMPGAWKKPAAQHGKKLTVSPPSSLPAPQPRRRVGGEESEDSGGVDSGEKEPVGEGRSSPTSQEADKDKLYRAFVRQWCFAQGP